MENWSNLCVLGPTDHDILWTEESQWHNHSTMYSLPSLWKGPLIIIHMHNTKRLVSNLLPCLNKPLKHILKVNFPYNVTSFLVHLTKRSTHFEISFSLNTLPRYNPLLAFPPFRRQPGKEQAISSPWLINRRTHQMLEAICLPLYLLHNIKMLSWYYINAYIIVWYLLSFSGNFITTNFFLS